MGKFSELFYHFMPITRFHWSSCSVFGVKFSFHLWLIECIFTLFRVSGFAGIQKLKLFSTMWRWMKVDFRRTRLYTVFVLKLRRSHRRKKMKLFAQRTVFCQKLFMSIYLLEAIRDNSSLVNPQLSILLAHEVAPKTMHRSALTNRWSFIRDSISSFLLSRITQRLTQQTADKLLLWTVHIQALEHNVIAQTWPKKKSSIRRRRERD